MGYRTESKATTVWPVSQLISGLPKLLQSQIRRSRYYTAGTDSLTFHAQTERRRASNLGENRAKLVEELRRIYHEVVPGETDPEDVKKHENK
jgi:peptidyl-tRNA hydrolase ICT1